MGKRSHQIAWRTVIWVCLVPLGSLVTSSILAGSILTGLILTESVLAGEISDAEFSRLLEQLRPAASDRWRTIPWKTSLLDAQREAVEKRRPIFIWAMDGHPLGCT